MLSLLAQATHGYRAHIACGVLREHGVEAHVLHENSGSLHGGASTTTASLWVRDDEWEEACEILATPPIEPLPEGNNESMNIPREFLPPVEAVAVGMAMVIFAASATASLLAFVPKALTRDDGAFGESALEFTLALLVQAVVAIAYGLGTGLLSAVLFPLLRIYRAESVSRLGHFLTLIGGIAIAIMIAMCL